MKRQDMMPIEQVDAGTWRLSDDPASGRLSAPQMPRHHRLLNESPTAIWIGDIVDNLAALDLAQVPTVQLSVSK